MSRNSPAVPKTAGQEPAISAIDHQSIRRGGIRGWVLLLLLFTAAVAMVQLYRSDILSYERLLRHEKSIRQFIANHSLWSLLLGFATYTVVSLIPGTSGKSILFGWLFGFWSGLVIVSGSLTLAATFGFLLSRYFFRDFAYRKFAFIVRRIDQSFELQGPAYLVMLRLLHLPYTPLNYALGATRISTTSFVLTTIVGMLPGNVAFVLAGSQLPTLEVLIETGVWSLIDFRVLAALSAAVIVPLLARHVAIHLKSTKTVCRNQREEDSSSALPDDFSSPRTLHS